MVCPDAPDFPRLSHEPSSTDSRIRRYSSPQPQNEEIRFSLFPSCIRKTTVSRSQSSEPSLSFPEITAIPPVVSSSPISSSGASASRSRILAFGLTILAPRAKALIDARVLYTGALLTYGISPFPLMAPATIPVRKLASYILP